MLLLIAVVLAIFFLPQPWGLVAVAAAALIEIMELLVFLWWSRRKRTVRVGVETFVGKRGATVTGLWPEGQVRVDGELWRARCPAGCDAGVPVTVRAVDGLVLEVEPA